MLHTFFQHTSLFLSPLLSVLFVVCMITIAQYLHPAIFYAILSSKLTISLALGESKAHNSTQQAPASPANLECMHLP